MEGHRGASKGIEGHRRAWKGMEGREGGGAHLGGGGEEDVGDGAAVAEGADRAGEFRMALAVPLLAELVGELGA